MNVFLTFLLFATIAVADNCIGDYTKCVPESACTAENGRVEVIGGSCADASLMCCFVGQVAEPSRKRQGILGGILGGDNNGGGGGDLGDLLNKGGMIADTLGKIGVIDKETADKVKAGTMAGMLLDDISKNGVNKDNLGDIIMKGGEIVMTFQDGKNQGNPNQPNPNQPGGNQSPCLQNQLTPYVNTQGQVVEGVCVNSQGQVVGLDGQPIPDPNNPTGAEPTTAEICGRRGFAPNKTPQGQVVDGQCINANGQVTDLAGNVLPEQPKRDPGVANPNVNAPDQNQPNQNQPNQNQPNQGLPNAQPGNNGNNVVGNNGERSLDRDQQIAMAMTPEDKEPLGVLAIVGIAVVGALFCMLLVVMAFCIVSRRNNDTTQVNVHNPAFGNPHTMNNPWAAPAQPVQAAYNTGSMTVGAMDNGMGMGGAPPRAYGQDTMGPPRPDFSASYATQMEPPAPGLGMMERGRFETAQDLPDVQGSLRHDTPNAQYGLGMNGGQANQYNQMYGEGPIKCPHNCGKSYFSQADCDQHVSLRHGL